MNSAGYSEQTSRISTLDAAFEIDSAAADALKADGAAYTAVGAVLQSVIASPEDSAGQSAAAIIAGGPASGPSSSLLASAVQRAPEGPLRSAVEASLEAGGATAAA
jgi:hypothetical protein